MPPPVRVGTEFLVNTTVAGDQSAPAVALLADGRFMVSWLHNAASPGASPRLENRAQIYAANGTPSGAEVLLGSLGAGQLSTDGAIAVLSTGTIATVRDVEVPVPGVFDFYEEDVRVRISEPNGSASGPEILVPTVLTDPQGFHINHNNPAIAALDGGGFVVTWTAYGGHLTGFIGAGDIYAQIFTDAGARVGSEILVNTVTTANQNASQVTALGDGRFVVTWQTDGDDRDGWNISAQIFTATGTRVGGEIEVNATEAGHQTAPAVAALDGGRFVISWTDTGGGSGGGIVRSQIFAADGSRVGGEFQISAASGTNFNAPAIAGLDGGRTVAVWIDNGQTGGDASGTSIRARVFNADGTAAGDDFLVNTTTAGGQTAPAVQALGGGRFVVTWQDPSQTGGDTSGSAIRAQVFDAGAAPPPPGPITGGSGPDSLAGDGGVDSIFGLEGNDQLFGRGGDDRLFGGAGLDRLDGGTGNDTMEGGLGNDRYIVDSLGDVVAGEVGFSLGGGIDTVESFVSFTLPANVEVLRLMGTANISGTGSGAPDNIVGNSGNNTLTGGFGNDLLNGKAGADRMIGGSGSDTLIGEAGNDTFVYLAATESGVGAAARDFINGFTHGQDRIDLSAIDARSGTGGTNDAFTFIGSAAFAGTGAASAGQLRFFTFGGGNFCVIEADRDGNGAADMQIFVNQTTFMTGGDFVL